MENQGNISIKSVIAFIIVIGLITLAIFSMDILMMLFASFVITCAIAPTVNKMEKRIPRVWCVALMLLALVSVSFLIIVPLLTIIIREAITLIGNFPSIIDNLDKLLNFQIFNKSLSTYITFDSLKEPLAQGAQSLIENSITAGKFIANLLTTLLAISIMVFYFAYDEKRIKDKFIEFFPVKYKEKASSILANIESKVGNYIFAQGIAMIFVGTLTTIGLLIIGNGHAFLLGFITCVFDIIPVIGPSIAVALGLITSTSGGVGYVLLTFLIYMIAQWAQNQLLRPILFGKMLNMHPLVIIVSLLICSRFLGFWGIILAPAIASVICVLVDELYLDRINNRE
ncbi:MAG: AI-2E family transporter [Candidatus Gastranaerophilales bacterium]|nr:AI-2E family transporter [Candidatus Gastranaerophilales bacterium]